jgi:hypothetical protein
MMIVMPSNCLPIANTCVERYRLSPNKKRNDGSSFDCQQEQGKQGNF